MIYLVWSLSDTSIAGFTMEPDARNLPTELGPWSKIGDGETIAFPPGTYDAASNAIVRSVLRDGRYLFQIKHEVTSNALPSPVLAIEFCEDKTIGDEFLNRGRGPRSTGPPLNALGKGDSVPATASEACALKGLECWRATFWKGRNSMADHDKQQDSDRTFGKSLRLIEETHSETEKGYRLMWQASDLIGQTYRLYLLNSHWKTEAAEFFSADDRATATAIAAAVQAASSDTFDSYELWQGGQRLVPGPTSEDSAEGADDPDDGVGLKYQHQLLLVEERLQDAFECVRRSRKLAETAKVLRERLGRFDDQRR